MSVKGAFSIEPEKEQCGRILNSSPFQIKVVTDVRYSVEILLPMRGLKININQTTMIVSILYINNAFFGLFKNNTILNAICLLCMILWLLYSSKKPGFLQSCVRTCMPLIIYTVFLALIYFFDGSKIGSSLWPNLRNATFSLLCSFLGLYILEQDERGRRKAFAFLMINIILGCLYTLFRIQENPLLPRILAMGAGDVETHLGKNVNTAGIITYGGIYGLVLVFPTFLYWISQKQGQKKIVPIIILTIILVTLYKSQFAIALIFVIIGILLYLLLFNGQTKLRFIISGLLIVISIIVAINWDNFLYALYSANILPSALQQKAHELLLYSEGGNLAGTNLYSRSTYYAQSFKAIVENNFVGKVFSNHARGAGHSEWEDMAANYGIIAPILVYSFFHKFTKKVFVHIGNKAATVYRIQLLILLIIGFIDPIFHSRTMSYLLFLSPLILALFGEASEEDGIKEQGIFV